MERPGVVKFEGKEIRNDAPSSGKFLQKSKTSMYLYLPTFLELEFFFFKL